MKPVMYRRTTTLPSSCILLFKHLVLKFSFGNCVNIVVSTDVKSKLTTVLLLCNNEIKTKRYRCGNIVIFINNDYLSTNELLKIESQMELDV